MRTPRASLVALIVLGGLVGAAAGCASTTSGQSRNAATDHRSPASLANGPSAAAKMVCEAEAQEEVAKALGMTASAPATGSWAAPVYTCGYVFPAGPMVLSVRELTSAAETTAYFTSAQNAATSSTKVPEVGDAAFAVADGSVYVRKDFKVLYVDVSKLPAFLGQPPISRAAAGVRVAGVIMSCWVGG
jgi:hypothetical protein